MNSIMNLTDSDRQRLSSLLSAASSSLGDCLGTRLSTAGDRVLPVSADDGQAIAVKLFALSFGKIQQVVKVI